ncbi:TPA: hypothetical protein UOK25_000892 [Stenotrophomonas maltophilia]|nr:hypothetical protein [Stenotrophomonas maltophilia]
MKDQTASSRLVGSKSTRTSRNVPAISPFHDIGGRCLIRLSELLYVGEIVQSTDGKAYAFPVGFINNDTIEVVGTQTELDGFRSELVEAANRYAISISKL